MFAQGQRANGKGCIAKMGPTASHACWWIRGFATRITPSKRFPRNNILHDTLRATNSGTFAVHSSLCLSVLGFFCGWPAVTMVLVLDNHPSHQSSLSLQRTSRDNPINVWCLRTCSTLQHTLTGSANMWRADVAAREGGNPMSVRAISEVATPHPRTSGSIP